MKSFDDYNSSIYEINNNNLLNNYLFKNIINKKKYITSNLKDILQFYYRNKKPNILQYVNFNKKIKLFFYIKINNKSEFECILNYNLNLLNINYNNLIIIQESEKLYLIIHTKLYFNNLNLLTNYLFQYKLLFVLIPNDFFVSTILNIYNIEYPYSDLQLSIINNIKKCNIFNSKINNLNNSEIINKQYVENIKTYFDKYESLFIKSKMGSGKTTASINYIKNVQSFLIISSRKSLTYTIYNKFKEQNINITNYIDSDINSIQLTKKLIISPDSLHKIGFPLSQFDFIWIDECVSLFNYINNTPYLNTNNIIIILQWLLQKSKNILFTDADLNNNIITFYNLLCKKNYHYIQYNYKNTINTKYILYDNEEKKLFLSIKNNLQLKKNIYICCDTLEKTKFIYNYIIGLNIINESDLLLLNSETHSSIIKKNVNEYWIQFRVIIVSPSIVYGVDFNLKHIHIVYSFIKGITITARESVQQIHRIRNIIDNTIYINLYKSKNYNLETNIVNIKYKLEVNDIKNLNIKIKLDNLQFTISDDGYRILDINYPYNYSFIINLSEKNKSLNDYKSELINIIKNI